MVYSHSKPIAKVGVEGVVELSPEEVVVLGEGDQAELECKVRMRLVIVQSYWVKCCRRP